MSKKTNSRIAKFYHKNLGQRLSLLQSFAQLSTSDIELLKSFSALDFDAANRMIENVISVMPIPLGIAPNFLINKKDYLIPMATEEPSVIAAASYAAKLARPTGGFTVHATDPIMIGQIQMIGIPNMMHALHVVHKYKKELIAVANEQDHILIRQGGGVEDIQARTIETHRGQMLIIDIFINVQDAMGANIANTMAESLAPRIEKLTGGHARLKIVSNLATRRIVTAHATWSPDGIGEEVIERILDAHAWAEADPYRCATHNKGIMNGIDAVALATGNDVRAIEAGAHAFAALAPKGYKPLTHYYCNNNGELVGTLQLPLAVGIVGGVTQSHPIAQVCLKILGIHTATELAHVMAVVGLAQNFGALRALVSEGIQRGHMRLHSKNVAINAGVPKLLIDKIAEIMVYEEHISVERAQELLHKLS